MSDSRQAVVTLLRAELGREVAAGFPRLRRVPQTDVIWFLDYFAGLTAAEREALLDALADAASVAFGPPSWLTLNARGTVTFPPGLARMVEAREGPGGKGGTRYGDVKMMCADPSFREPGGYHASWRERLTPLHFQPRPDLVPSPDDLKAAKAPLVRKLVNAALTKALGLSTEKQPGGVTKAVGRCGAFEVIVRVDFGGMLSQLGYTVTFRDPGGSIVVPQLSYEVLWGTGGRWDYLTEENSPRSVEFFAEQVAYLAGLVERVKRPGPAVDAP